MSDDLATPPSARDHAAWLLVEETLRNSDVDLRQLSDAARAALLREFEFVLRLNTRRLEIFAEGLLAPTSEDDKTAEGALWDDSLNIDYYVPLTMRINMRRNEVEYVLIALEDFQSLGVDGCVPEAIPASSALYKRAVEISRSVQPVWSELLVPFWLEEQ